MRKTILSIMAIVGVGAFALGMAACNNHKHVNLPNQNNVYHYIECTVCGEQTEKAVHNFVGGVCSCGLVDRGTAGLSYALSADGSYYIVNGAGSFTGDKLVIPAVHNGLPVRVIAKEAFMGSNITSLEVMSGVHLVEKSAFENCTSLTEIIIGEDVVAVEGNAFVGCSSIEKATVSTKAVYAVPTSALKELIVQGGETLGVEDGLGDDIMVMRAAPMLEKVVIGDSVRNIYSAFYECKKLTDITLPDTVERVEKSSFHATGYWQDEENWDRGFLYLNKCLLGAKNTITGGVVIKDGTVVIAERAFDSFREITNVRIPASVRTIGEMAFSDCRALTSISFSEGLKYVADEAFISCDNLTDVVLPESVEYLGRHVFMDTAYYNDEANWNDGALYNGKHLVAVKPDRAVGEFKIKKGTRTIGGYAFAGCTQLTGIELPDSLVGIGERAFAGCTALTQAVIPDAVKTLGAGAFDQCAGLTEVKLSSSLQQLRSDTFAGCAALTSVSIPKNVQTIEHRAFDVNCVALTSVVIEDVSGWVQFNFRFKSASMVLTSDWASAEDIAYALKTTEYRDVFFKAKY